MDHDDVCRPDRFAKQISYLRLHPGYVAVGARVLFIDEDGMPIHEVVDRYSHEDIERALLSTQIGIAHPSAVIRKSALKAVGGYRADYPHAEDLDLFLRLAEIGRLANLPEVLLEYRQQMTSVSYQHTRQQSMSARAAVLDACKRRGTPWDDVEKTIASAAVTHTPSELHRKWAWWALAAGNLSTARKHAFRALRYQPGSLATWRLIACVLRGY
jgi:glycosyl transferase family 2